MTLWLWGALRQWQRHRFGTFLLIAAYGLGIALSTVVYAGIAAAEAREKEIGMGDPLRMVALTVTAPAEGEITVAPDVWLAGIPVATVRVFFNGRGGELDPALQDRTVVAMAGPGPLSWHPPLRTGRFLAADEIAGGAKVAVMGEQLPATLSGYRVVGRMADQSYNRGWDRDIFVPLATLPSSFHHTTGLDLLVLHVEVAPGADVVAAKAQIESNLGRALPRASITVQTAQEGLQATVHRFQRSFAIGFGLSGLLLAFIAANVGVLSMHWLLQRKRELGVRLALGGTKPQLAAMIAFEHACLGLAGALAAVPLVAVAMYAASHVGLPLEISTRTLLAAGRATVLGGLLGVLVPLAALLRAPLVESLHLQD